MFEIAQVKRGSQALVAIHCSTLVNEESIIEILEVAKHEYYSEFSRLRPYLTEILLIITSVTSKNPQRTVSYHFEAILVEISVDGQASSAS